MLQSVSVGFEGVNFTAGPRGSEKYVKIKIALSKDEVRILIKILVGDHGPS